MTNLTLNLIAIMLAILVGFEVYDRGSVWYAVKSAENAVERAENAAKYQQCIDRGHPTLTAEELETVCRGMYGR